MLSLGKYMLPYLPSPVVVDRVGMIPAIVTWERHLDRGGIVGMCR